MDPSNLFGQADESVPAMNFDSALSLSHYPLTVALSLRALTLQPSHCPRALTLLIWAFERWSATRCRRG
jgi:hypothetical protein